MDITLDTKTVRYANGGCEHDPALPGVVLVHGAGMNRTVFQLQTRYLAHHGYRVAAIDLPGHGGSEGPAIETVPEMGAWLADVIVALDMGPAHVIGHSMGTFIGIEAAAQRPETVASLVLIGTAAAMPVHPELLDGGQRRPHAPNLMSSELLVPRLTSAVMPRPGCGTSGRALLDTSRPDSLGIDMAACNAYATRSMPPLPSRAP